MASTDGMQYQRVAQEHDLSSLARASLTPDGELVRRVLAALKDDAGFRPKLEALFSEQETANDAISEAIQGFEPLALSEPPQVCSVTKLLPVWLRTEIEGYILAPEPVKELSQVKRLPRELREHIYSMLGPATKTEDRVIMDIEGMFKGSEVTVPCCHQFCVNDDGVNVMAYSGQEHRKLDVASLTRLLRVDKSFQKGIMSLLFQHAVLCIDVTPMSNIIITRTDRAQVYDEYFNGLPLHSFSTVVLYYPSHTYNLFYDYLRTCENVLKYPGTKTGRATGPYPLQFRNRTIQRVILVLPHNARPPFGKKKPRGKMLQLATFVNDLPVLFSQFEALKTIATGGHYSSFEEMQIQRWSKDMMERVGDFMAERIWEWDAVEQGEATRKASYEVPRPLLVQYLQPGDHDDSDH